MAPSITITRSACSIRAQGLPESIGALADSSRLEGVRLEDLVFRSHSALWLRTAWRYRLRFQELAYLILDLFPEPYRTSLVPTGAARFRTAVACRSMRSAEKQQGSMTGSDGIPSATPTVSGWMTRKRPWQRDLANVPKPHGDLESLLRGVIWDWRFA